MAEIQNSPESIGGRIKRAVTVTGMTAETKLPNRDRKLQQNADGEFPNPKRTLDERFERGKMFRIIKRIIKKRNGASGDEKEVWNQRFHKAVELSRGLRHNLDELNREYYNPECMQFVSVDVLGEHVEIPVRRYSLKNKEAQSNDQALPPIVIIGGATSGPTVTKGTAEAFALQYPGRDVYVIGHPDSKLSRISEALPKKLKEQGSLATYTQINKDVLTKLGFEKFDLVGISMGGGIVLQAATDPEFAKKINNLIAISPTSMQEIKGKAKFLLMDFLLREGGHSWVDRKRWLRVGQQQQGSQLGSHEGMGFAEAFEIFRHKDLSADKLAGIRTNGRVIIGTGDKDAMISCEQIARETNAANGERIKIGNRLIEFMQVKGGHHDLRDTRTAGMVALIRNTSKLPEQIGIEKLPATTAEVLVRENGLLASIADRILK